MSIRKTVDFLADVERQFEWYTINAGGEVADCYLEAVEATCRLLSRHPRLGPVAELSHPRLRDWRFILVFRPFKKHILFYEVVAGDVVVRRVLRGERDLPPRLLEGPAQD